MPDLRLGPQAIAKRLFIIDPDRDERASQLCMETLLTIMANGYKAPEGEPASPKLRRFAVRSLVFSESFLAGSREPLRGGGLLAEEYGELLAAGQDFRGSDNLALAQSALRNLVDPSTEQGRNGQRLMLPFHESLLWYDARESSGQHTVRKVRMRGSGITFARMLLDPPTSTEAAPRPAAGVEALRKALSDDSPLSDIAKALEQVLPDGIVDKPVTVSETDEKQSWALGGDVRLAPFARSLRRHVEGVMCQGATSAPAKLWQLRTILALEYAVHMLRQAWEAVQEPEPSRWLLVASPGPERSQDRVRLRSEHSYADARTAIRSAIIYSMAQQMADLGADPTTQWEQELEGRTLKLLEASVMPELRRLGARDYPRLARLAFENANYDRPGEGFRVLLESIGMSAGGTRFRYLSATPDLLAALVGALSIEMPMTSSKFFRRVGEEWGLVMSPDAALGTTFRTELDGSDLAINARRFERLMIEGGLASGLSDRTVLVGERAGGRER